jgi:hypothetical protein
MNKYEELTENFLKWINYSKLDHTEYHKKLLFFLYGDFFEPFTYKRMLNSSKIFEIRGNTVFYNKYKPLNPVQATRELFDTLPNMLDVQNKSLIDLKDYIDQVDTMDGKKKNPPKHFLTNFLNSCSIDSLLFIFFFFQHSYFIDIIQNGLDEPDPLVQNSEAFSDDIKKPLLTLYTSGKWNTQIMNIQRKISKYIEGSCSNIKSITEILNMFSAAFPGLQFEVQTKKGEEIKNKPYYATYLDPTFDNNPDNITSKPQHLIYGDDQPPKKRDLRKLGYSMDHGNYVLAGVIFFIEQCHYTATIKGEKHWWYYDDMAKKNKLLKNPESGIFKENRNKKAQILFYIRQ